jgi:hypothetical protein
VDSDNVSIEKEEEEEGIAQSPEAEKVSEAVPFRSHHQRAFGHSSNTQKE